MGYAFGSFSGHVFQAARANLRFVQYFSAFGSVIYSVSDVTEKSIRPTYSPFPIIVLPVCVRCPVPSGTSGEWRRRSQLRWRGVLSAHILGLRGIFWTGGDRDVDTRLPMAVVRHTSYMNDKSDTRGSIGRSTNPIRNPERAKPTDGDTATK